MRILRNSILFALLLAALSSRDATAQSIALNSVSPNIGSTGTSPTIAITYTLTVPNTVGVCPGTFVLLVNGALTLSTASFPFLGGGAYPFTSNFSIPSQYLASPSTLSLQVNAHANTVTGGSVDCANPNGSPFNQTTSPLPFLVLAPPAITSLNPASALLNSSSAVGLSINGTGFVPAQSGFPQTSTVFWTGPGGATTTLSFSFISSTLISATIPPTLLTTPGTASIIVTNPDGTSTAPRPFNVVPPGIATISPASANAAGPDVPITVSGSGFTNGATVQFQSGSATILLATGFVDANTLTAIIPSTAIVNPGAAIISVKNPDGSFTNARPFSIATPSVPAINLGSGLTPAAISSGGGSFQVSVQGLNFVSGAVVQWNPGSGPTPLTTTFIDSTHLTAIVTGTLIANPGQALITVSNPGNVQSNAVQFAVNGSGVLPTVSSLTPTSAPAGSVATQLTVTGANFTAGSIVQWIGPTGAQNLATTFVSSAQLSAIITTPLLATPGYASVSVLGANNVTTSPQFFLITAPAAATTTSIAPSSANAAGADLPIVVTGTGFVSGDAVQFQTGTATLALATGFSSSTTLTAIIPASAIAAPGAAIVSVKHADGTFTNAKPFSIGSPTVPAINLGGGLSPAAAQAGAGAFQMSITGLNFLSGATVQWNPGSGATALATTFIDSSHLTAIVPASLVASPGQALITVLNPGSAVSNAVQFPINGSGPLSILGTITPQAATVGSVAVALSLTGANFTSNSIVQWIGPTGTQNLTTSYVSPGQLNTFIPAGLLTSAGYASISVLGQNNVPSNSLIFLIGPSTAIVNGITPLIVSAGGPAFTLSVSGTNFLPGAIVQLDYGSGPQNISTGYLSSSSVSAIVPAGLIANPGIIFVSVLNPGSTVPSNASTLTVAPAQGPTISVASGLVPASAQVGATSVQLTINGTNFASGAMVQWKTSTATTPLATAFVSSGQLTAIVPSTLLNAPGLALVSVLNPGNAASNAIPFPVNGSSPPVIATLSATSLAAGSGSQQLSVNSAAPGTFVNGAVVKWNNGVSSQSLATGFTSSLVLTAIVPAGLLSSGGFALVTVTNPDGSTSNSQSIEITAGSAQAPSVSTSNGLSPQTFTAGGATQQLIVNGMNFQSGSIVQWNSGTGPISLTTGIVGSTTNIVQLTALVPASLITTPGTVLITVLNPGGLVSNVVTLNILPPAGTSPPTISVVGGLGPVTPASLRAGSPDSQIDVYGSNFASTSVVQWNSGSGPVALSTGFVDATHVSAIVPARLLTTQGVAFITVVNSGGATSNSFNFTISAPAGNTPSITNLNPASLAAGSPSQTLALTGTNFINGATVQWNTGGSPQTLTTGFLSAGQLNALIPAALLTTPGTAFVTVTNPGGVASNTIQFVITGAAPTISSLSQTFAAAGSSSFQLTVTGTNFGIGSVLSWGGTALPTTVVSGTQLIATVGANLLATAGAINVTVTSGTFTSNAVPFSISAPVISILSPASVPQGAQGFILTVGGTGFVSGSVILWGTTQLVTTFGSTSQLSAVIPSTLLTAAAAVNVTVQNPGPVSSAPKPFSIGPAPAISALAPASAAPGSSGFVLTITGTNFISSDIVFWNGAPLPTHFGSAASLTADVGASLLAATGSINVTVLDPGGVISNVQTFQITAATITGISPASAAAGSSSLQIIVTGTGFLTGTTILWNGSSISTTVTSGTQLTGLVDASLLAAPGTAFVQIQNPGGSQSSPVKFQIFGPTLTTIAPTTAVAGGAAFSLTVTGTNFSSGSTVQWSGTNLATAFQSATQLTAQVPAALIANAGTANVTVVNAGGSGTAVLTFTITIPPAPSVTALTPSSATAGGAAFQLSVTGNGFVNGGLIQWNGTSLPTNYLSSTQLAAFVDGSLVSQAGTVNIAVQNPGAALSNILKFPVNAPTISTLSPNTASAGGAAFTVTIAGSGFIPGSAVQWNSTALPTLYSGPTQLSAPVPANLIASAGSVSVTVLNPGGAISAGAPFTIGPSTLTISTSQLPDAVVGASYSQTLAASGGSPPYTWSVSSGALPAGLALDPASGTIGGTPTAAALVNLGVSVIDSAQRVVSRTFNFRVITALQITTMTPLPSVPVNTPYTQTLLGTGGTPPYNWAVAGTLPAGLTLNAASGVLAGTPTAAGSYRVTIGLSDSRIAVASQTFDLIVLPVLTTVTVSGVPDPVSPAQQLPIAISVPDPFPTALTGTLNLGFVSSVGGTDSTILLSNGTATANFTIAAGSTQGVFTPPTLTVATGTLAGTLTLSVAGLKSATADVTPSPAPALVAHVSRSAPVVTSASVARTTSGFNVTFAGYTDTREVTNVLFHFVPVAGKTLSLTDVTQNLSAALAAYFQSSASATFGGQFSATIPFNLSGDLSAIASVVVSLSNSQGTSAPVTANF